MQELSQNLDQHVHQARSLKTKQLHTWSPCELFLVQSHTGNHQNISHTRNHQNIRHEVHEVTAT